MTEYSDELASEDSDDHNRAHNDSYSDRYTYIFPCSTQHVL